MRFLDLTLDTLAENLALDEALLLDAEARTSEVLRVWEWPFPVVVLGAAGRLAEEVNEDNCRADSVPLVRRSSGGGAVLLGPGCLNYTLVLAYGRDPALAEVRSSYCYILGKLCEGLRLLAPGLECAGTSDLAINGFKVSGNSQQRKRTHLLHHGTLLYSFDVAKMNRYLRMPPRQPGYRQQRSHADFIQNLATSMDAICESLRDIWEANEESESIPTEMVARLLKEKYSDAAWIRRR